jgi:hypothetical protein
LVSQKPNVFPAQEWHKMLSHGGLMLHPRVTQSYLTVCHLNNPTSLQCTRADLGS